MRNDEERNAAIRHLTERMNRIEIVVGNLPAKTDAALMSAIEHAIACLSRSVAKMNETISTKELGEKE